MPKIQVVIDENVHRVLTQMSKAKLRGGTVSQIAYKILDEWVWHNQDNLDRNGIVIKKR